MSDETTHSAVFEADSEEDRVRSAGLSHGTPMSVLWWIESTADDLEHEDGVDERATTLRRLGVG